MRKQPPTSERSWNPTDRRRHPATMKPRETTDARIAALAQFDTDAWVALLAEQRLRIAAAAGVDPSRVRIQVGH